MLKLRAAKSPEAASQLIKLYSRQNIKTNLEVPSWRKPTLPKPLETDPGNILEVVSHGYSERYSKTIEGSMLIPPPTLIRLLDLVENDRS